MPNSIFMNTISQMNLRAFNTLTGTSKHVLWLIKITHFNHPNTGAHYYTHAYMHTGTLRHIHK